MNDFGRSMKIKWVPKSSWIAHPVASGFLFSRTSHPRRQNEKHGEAPANTALIQYKT
jgi:hypothetical protein